MSFGRVDPSAQIAYADDGGSKQAWIWWYAPSGQFALTRAQYGTSDVRYLGKVIVDAAAKAPALPYESTYTGLDADGDHYVGGGEGIIGPGNDAYAAQRQDNTIIVAQYFLDPTGNLGLSYIVNSMYAPTMGDWNTRRGKIYL